MTMASPRGRLVELGISALLAFWLAIGILYAPGGDVVKGLLFGTCGFLGMVLFLSFLYRLFRS